MEDKINIEELFNLKTVKAVDDFLSKLDIADSSKDPSTHKFIWRLANDSISNAANIENTTATIAGIVERITNGYDAFIELKALENNKSDKIPSSPRESIEKWFGIPHGDIAKLGSDLEKMKNNQERTNLAKSFVSICFYDSGDERKPTITIRDMGIGQHPDQFPRTFLRLGESNKMELPYLHGTFGQGGSATYRFCTYAIIISRRHPNDKTVTSDDIGWTIVRKDNNEFIWSFKENRIVRSKKPPVYEYLCHSDGKVPRFSAVLKKDFIGTLVIHVQYDAQNWRNLSIGGGYRIFRNYLFDPVLPFRLEDLRENRKQDFDRNMFGAYSTLLSSNDVIYKNEAVETFNEKDKMVIRYWVLLDESDSSRRPLKNFLARDNSKETIILTLNGQRHGALERNIVSKKARLPNLADFLLIQVVCDNMPREMKGGIFTSNRESIVEGDVADFVKEKIVEALLGDEKLREWDKKVIRHIFNSKNDESTKSVKKILDNLIKIGIEPGIGGSKKVELEGGIGNVTDYEPSYPPTEFKFLLEQDPIEIENGSSRSFLLGLNGKDNLFKSKKHNAKVTCNIKENSGVSVKIDKIKFQNGRLPVKITSSNSTEFEPRKISFKFECDGLQKPLEIERQYVVVMPPTYIPNDPPTRFKIIRGEPIKLIKGKRNNINVAFDGPNDILDRYDNRAELTINFRYDKCKLSRIRHPNNGIMQITLDAEDDANIGDTFVLECSLKLSDGVTLTDSKKCIISEPKQKTNNKLFGGYSSATLPKYKVEPVFKTQWAGMGEKWNEDYVGEFRVEKDEDGSDMLILYVNANNSNIDNELERREIEGHSNTTRTGLLYKYIAYIGYHLYLQFESDRAHGEYDTENISSQQSTDKADSSEMNEDSLQDELRRVSKTLIVSFKSIVNVPEQED